MKKEEQKVTAMVMAKKPESDLTVRMLETFPRIAGRNVAAKEKERAKARRAKATRTGHASTAIPGIVHIGLSASTRTARAARQRAARLAAAAVQQTATCTLPRDTQEPKQKKQRVRLQSPTGAGGTSRSADCMPASSSNAVKAKAA